MVNTSEPGERVWVRAETPRAISEALDSQFRGPLFAVRIGAVFALTLLALVGLIAPFLSPIREAVGWYLYVHLGVVAIAAYLFFSRVVPPPRRASESRRRRFMARANDGRLRRAGLDSSGIVSSRLLSDGHTLELVMTPDWLVRSHEERLRNTQEFWWLWTTVYAPPEGSDKVRVRLVDDKGVEVAGSHPETGSLLWTF